MGVLGGRPRAGQGDAGASQVPLWSLPRVNMRACDVSNQGDSRYIRDLISSRGDG